MASHRLTFISLGTTMSLSDDSSSMLADDADCHKFKVAVPREFARKLDEYLATWDEADESPKITLTLTIPEPASAP